MEWRVEAECGNVVVEWLCSHRTQEARKTVPATEVSMWSKVMLVHGVWDRHVTSPRGNERGADVTVRSGRAKR